MKFVSEVMNMVTDTITWFLHPSLQLTTVTVRSRSIYALILINAWKRTVHQKKGKATTTVIVTMTVTVTLTEHLTMLMIHSCQNDWIHACRCIYTQTQTHKHAYIHPKIYVHNTYMRTYRHTYIHDILTDHTCHKRVRTHTQTHIHTQKCWLCECYCFLTQFGL